MIESVLMVRLDFSVKRGIVINESDSGIVHLVVRVGPGVVFYFSVHSESP